MELTTEVVLSNLKLSTIDLCYHEFQVNLFRLGDVRLWQRLMLLWRFLNRRRPNLMQSSEEEIQTTLFLQIAFDAWIGFAIIFGSNLFLRLVILVHSHHYPVAILFLNGSWGRKLISAPNFDVHRVWYCTLSACEEIHKTIGVHNHQYRRLYTDFQATPCSFKDNRRPSKTIENNQRQCPVLSKN